jgi:recombination protein RecA
VQRAIAELTRLGEYKAKRSALKNAAQLRKQIENTLTARIPSALSPRQRIEPERIACGIAALDDLLLGGLPVGMLSELVGPESSGRTTAALSLVANVTRAEQVAAWIDVADTLDPASASANGVNLERLLWVRCGTKNDSPAVEEPKKQGMSVSVVTDASTLPARGGGSPHPRTEGKGMPEAISAMLQSHGGLYDKPLRRAAKSIGTPGSANRPLMFRSEDREEQVSSDRVPARRGETYLDPQRAKSWTVETRAPLRATKPPAKRPWDALDQALRTADLLLQGGGFSVIVFDLGSVPVDMVWRIPLATWFRFRTACERTQVSLLLLTQHPCARSASGLVVRMSAGQMQAQGNVMTGIDYRAETERRRFSSGNVVSIRKQPQSEHGQNVRWSGGAVWATQR